MRAAVFAPALLAVSFAAADTGAADALLERDPPPRRLDAAGKRLDTTIGGDIETLADAYVQTKNPKYLERAKVYMKAAAGYSDWKPGYYLTCAQIMNGFSRALEVCGQDMGKDFREEMQDVLLKKGLKGSFLGWWWWSKDNWTQVCCSAVAYAALQIRDRYPGKANAYLEDAIGATKSAMEAYGPDGCYAEGPAYWGYATENTERMIAVLKRCNGGDDGGLGSVAGYRESFGWIEDMTGPSGQIFNYADGWRPGAERKRDFPGNGRKIYRGVQPTAYLCSSNVWIAIKGGSAKVNHAHMDAGSFVFDTFLENGGGIRWIEDPYTEDYCRMEQAGLKVWNTAQNSTRWKVFRQGMRSHSVFAIDGKNHKVSGKVSLAEEGENGISADCSELYDGVWKSARRSWRLTEDGFVLCDSFEGMVPGREYTFNFVTFAYVETDAQRAVLNRSGERVEIVAVHAGRWELEDVAKPKEVYDSPNPGLTRVVFRCMPTDMPVEFRFRPVRSCGRGGEL